jgi:hypothetical protein
MLSLKKMYGLRESVVEGGPGSGPKPKSKSPAPVDDMGMGEPDGDEGGLPPELVGKVRDLIQALEALVPDEDPEGDDPDAMGAGEDTDIPEIPKVPGPRKKA